MNNEYISGFFDADGYVTLVKMAKNRRRTIVIGFTNNKIDILEDIKYFLETSGASGIISTKKPRSANHQTSYDLKFVGFNNAKKLIPIINTRHSKKKSRFELIDKLIELTPRNGKYTESISTARSIVEDKFLSITI